MARRVRHPFPAEQRRGLGTLRTIDEDWTAVQMHWDAFEIHSVQTYTRMTETVIRFTDRLAAVGVTSFDQVTPEHARAFITAALPDGRAPEVNTQHARRTAIRVLYRTLRQVGRPVGDPTLDIALPPRGDRVARPLTDEEVTLCRASAQAIQGRSGSMRPVAWALGEATAVSSEITAVRVSDLDDPASPVRVRLPGTRRVRARTVPLTEWGRWRIAGRVCQLRNAGRLRADTLLAYGGACPPGGAKAQAAVCNALRDVLASAGLSEEVDIRPASLRHWAGRTAYDAGATVQDVAVLLGHRSLDATAEDIALDWYADAVGLTTEVA